MRTWTRQPHFEHLDALKLCGLRRRVLQRTHGGRRRSAGPAGAGARQWRHASGGGAAAAAGCRGRRGGCGCGVRAAAAPRHGARRARRARKQALIGVVIGFWRGLQVGIGARGASGGLGRDAGARGGSAAPGAAAATGAAAAAAAAGSGADVDGWSASATAGGAAGAAATPGCCVVWALEAA